MIVREFVHFVCYPDRIAAKLRGSSNFGSVFSSIEEDSRRLVIWYMFSRGVRSIRSVDWSSRYASQIGPLRVFEFVAVVS